MYLSLFGRMVALYFMYRKPSAPSDFENRKLLYVDHPCFLSRTAISWVQIWLFLFHSPLHESIICVRYFYLIMHCKMFTGIFSMPDTYSLRLKHIFTAQLEPCDTYWPLLLLSRLVRAFYVRLYWTTGSSTCLTIYGQHTFLRCSCSRLFTKLYQYHSATVSLIFALFMQDIYF